MSTEELRKAVELFESLPADHEPDGWPAVRMRDITLVVKALRDQEAEIARLNAELVVTRQTCLNVGGEFAKQRDRSEKAGALLREAQAIIDDYLPDHPRDAAFNVSARITAHLGATHD